MQSNVAVQFDESAGGDAMPRDGAMSDAEAVDFVLGETVSRRRGDRPGLDRRWASGRVTAAFEDALSRLRVAGERVALLNAEAAQRPALELLESESRRSALLRRDEACLEAGRMLLGVLLDGGFIRVAFDDDAAIEDDEAIEVVKLVEGESLDVVPLAEVALTTGGEAGAVEDDEASALLEEVAVAEPTGVEAILAEALVEAARETSGDSAYGPGAVKARGDAGPEASAPRVVSEPVVVSDEMIDTLRSGFGPKFETALDIERQKQAQARRDAVARDRLILSDVLNHLGKPPTGLNAETGPGEVAKLEKGISKLEERYDELSTETRHLLFKCMVARYRFVKEQMIVALRKEEQQERFKGLWSRIDTVSRGRQPGATNGMAREHEPKKGKSWSDDAAAYWGELRKICPEKGKGPAEKPEERVSRHRAIEQVREAVEQKLDVKETAKFQALVLAALDAGVQPKDPMLLAALADVSAQQCLVGENGPRLKALRDALKQQRKAEEESDSGGSFALPQDWPGFAYTRDKVAVIVWSENRQDKLDRLEQTFGFASCEFVCAAEPASVRAAEERIRNGSIDLVLLTRFRGHKSDVLRDAAKDADVAFAFAGNAGLGAVKNAIEQQVIPREEGETGQAVAA